MENTINTIVKCNSKLFGNNPSINRVNVGFTNAIYVINDMYIVKICIDRNNEENFKKEIEFYLANSDNDAIPKLYRFSTDKKEVGYYYEIMEKLTGVSLYNVWHTFSENERENIISKLCKIIRQIHSNVGNSYDWKKKISDEFDMLYKKAKSLNLFNIEEQKVIDLAYSKFSDYLDADKFVLIHNDLHFDNIFYKDGKIKLIDFERSVYAPKDFELDILYRMIRKPWKFASEKTEEYTKLEDYENIMKYIEKYYPEIIYIDNVYKRLAIYDVIYYLKQYINNPSIIELKEDVLNAAEIVLE